MGVGFRGSHRAGDSVPLPGPPHPPDMAPDPHDDGDFEDPDTRSLLDEFMTKMSQSINDDYRTQPNINGRSKNWRIPSNSSSQRISK